MKRTELGMALMCSVLVSTAAHARPCEPQVINIVAKQYGRNTRDLSGASQFLIGDAGPNTIEDVEIKQGVEEAFGITIPDPTWRSFRVIRDIVGYLNTHAPRCR